MTIKIKSIEEMFRDAIAKLAPTRRNEFLIKEDPRGCMEYISSGIGDISCPGNLNRLSTHVWCCDLCKSVYIKDDYALFNETIR